MTIMMSINMTITIMYHNDHQKLIILITIIVNSVHVYSLNA